MADNQKQKEIVLCKMFSGNYWEDENNIGYESINMFLPDNSNEENPISYIYLPADGDYKTTRDPEYIILTQKFSGKPNEVCVKVLGVASISDKLFSNIVGENYTCIGGGNNFDIMTFLYEYFGDKEITENEITEDVLNKLKEMFKSIKENKRTGYIKSIYNGKLQSSTLVELHERSKILAKVHNLQVKDIKDKKIEYNGKLLSELFLNNSSYGPLNILTTFEVKNLILLKKKSVYLTNNKVKFKYLCQGAEVFYLNQTNLSSTSQATYLNLDDFNATEIGLDGSAKIKYTFKDFIKKIIDNENNAQKLKLDEFEKGFEPSFLTRIKKEYDELSYSNLFAYFFSISPSISSWFFKNLKIDKKNLNLDVAGSIIDKIVNISKDEWSALGGESVSREERNIDIIIKAKEHLVVIENKIKSALNGHDDEDINGERCKDQLIRYYKYIESNYNQKNKIFLIFAPDYNPIDKENLGTFILDNNEISMSKIWKIVRYSEVLECFSKYDYEKDKNFSPHDKMLYAEFLKALKVHTVESLQNYYREMQIRMRKLFN